MSEAQNWGNMFAGPDKAKHFPWALLGDLFSPLKKTKVRVEDLSNLNQFCSGGFKPECSLLMPMKFNLAVLRILALDITYLNFSVAFFSLFLLSIGSPLLGVSLQIVR